MAYFLIKYIGQEGGVLTKPVDALTREEAISKSGIPSKIIQSVSVDHLGGIRNALTDKRLPKNEQVLALVTIASKLESGKTSSRAIIEAVDYEQIGITKEQFDACEFPADYLTVLRFDETAILLAEAGDKSGKLADAFKRAASVIREREKTRKEFAKPMKSAAINFVVGVGAGIGFPIFGGRMLYKFIYEQNFPIEPSVLSEVLMGLNSFYSNYWPFLLLTIALISVFRAKLWSVVRYWPFFQLFDNRIRVRRGLDFVQTYQLLTSSGYTNPMVFKFLLERAKGQQRKMYEDALQRLKEGRELGEIFDDPEWPRIIAQNLQGFEQQTPDGRERVLSNLSEALTEIFVQYSEKIAGSVAKLSMIILLSSVLLFALGFYVPLMTMRIGV